MCTVTRLPRTAVDLTNILLLSIYIRKLLCIVSFNSANLFYLRQCLQFVYSVMYRYSFCTTGYHTSKTFPVCVKKHYIVPNYIQTKIINISDNIDFTI